ncbi:hypothetical protein [Alicyclobacillus macrosporangiidus]|uniref:hypothetical protein n=1 Tax=Alicyclobacillus macrosporangiidus TaxID=392015 RepID=UPI0012DE8865|nr:hypothetical protein [Alicyclobacillus macrosporangiidus]
MITRTHCMPFIGQPVVARTRTGVTHYGILHTVTGDGIYLRRVGGGIPRLVSETDVNAANLDLLQNMPQPTDDVRQAFFPFFFLPFLALAAIGPWGWW